ncbi:MAG: ABC transporter permease [Anaerolineae bacterium]
MFDQVIGAIFSAAFLASILRVTTPILLPSMGALISSSAGVLNIGLEGMMLASAFTGVAVSAYSMTWFGPDTGAVIGPWVGMLAGVGVAMALALLLGFFHLRLKTNLVLTGIAINIIGSAATVALMFELTGDRGATTRLASLQMPFIQLPEFINSIPIIGPFIYGVFNNQNVMTWIAFISVAVVWFVMYRTSFGMHLRGVGENPSAAESVGINVNRTRYYALILSGLFAGLGGIFMSMGFLSIFQRDMTAGRGFIALATPLLGGGTPIGTMFASLVFGFFGALSIRLGTLAIPPEMTAMIPYVATIMALVIYALNNQQSQRVRSLRAAEGEGFNAAYWKAIQRLSLLHVVLAMVAMIGFLVAICLFAAPNGFGGVEQAYPLAITLTIGSAILVGVELPFIRRVQLLERQVMASAIICTVSLGVYLALFLSLFFQPPVAIGTALLLGLVVWLVLGGWSLIQRRRTLQPAT